MGVDFKQKYGGTNRLSDLEADTMAVHHEIQTRGP